MIPKEFLQTHVYGDIYHKINRATCTGYISKVTLLQQRIPGTPLYHVGLAVEERGFSKIFEHGPIRYDPYRPFEDDGINVLLPPIKHTIRALEEFESTLPTQYVLGLRDCRHHVLDFLEYMYP